MVNATVAAEGKYIKPEHVNDSKNKIAVITSEGEYSEGKFGKKLEIDIQFNKIMKVWSLNQGTANSLLEAYGEETADWVGKKVQLEVKETNNGKFKIIGIPVDGKTPEKSPVEEKV